MSKGRAQGKKGMNEGDGRTRGKCQALAQDHREAVSFNAADRPLVDDQVAAAPDRTGRHS